MFISSAYAQTAGGGAGNANSLLGLLPFVLIFGLMYFLMIRPQMKKQKEINAMLSALAKGDEVVTSGGVLGKIAKLGESYVTLEIAAGTEIQVQRSAIVQVLPRDTFSPGK